MTISSEKVLVQAKIEEIKSFLQKPENYWLLLPQDKVSDFEYDEISCIFKAQGGVSISLVLNGLNENNILLKSGEKSPFPFRLEIVLNEMEDGIEGNIEFDGEVNMFLKMMVEKPLLSLFNYMSRKLKDHFEK